MWVELGHFALVLAFVVVLVQSTLPWLGLARNDARIQLMAHSTVHVQTALLLLSFVLLTYGFLINDFSVDYIARQSNTLLPIEYKISAVWGGITDCP